MLEIGDFERPDHIVHPVLPLPSRQFLQAEGDILACSQVWKQGKVLEHHPHASLLHRDGWSCPGDRAAVDAHLTAPGLHKPGYGAQHGSFAAAAGTQQATDVAPLKTQGDIRNDVLAVQHDCQVVNIKHVRYGIVRWPG